MSLIKEVFMNGSRKRISKENNVAKIPPTLCGIDRR